MLFLSEVDPLFFIDVVRLLVMLSSDDLNEENLLLTYKSPLFFFSSSYFSLLKSVFFFIDRIPLCSLWIMLKLSSSSGISWLLSVAVNEIVFFMRFGGRGREDLF